MNTQYHNASANFDTKLKRAQFIQSSTRGRFRSTAPEDKDEPIYIILPTVEHPLDSQFTIDCLLAARTARAERRSQPTKTQCPTTEPPTKEKT